MANNSLATPLKVVTGDGLAYYHEKVKALTNEAKGVELTQAEYDALSDEEKLNGTTYYIKDASSEAITASSVVYKDSNVASTLDTINSELSSIKSDDGIVKSANADYAEICMWSDKNPDNEDRIGYFVTVSKTEAGITMVKSTSTSDVRGVTVSQPAFAAGASSDKYDENGKLLTSYNYVAFAGFVKVYDNGSCTIGERCMCDDNGCAIPSTNNMGYEVIDRIDSTSILILVEPSGDMLQRIKEDVSQLETGLNTVTPIRLTQAEYDVLPDTKLTDGKTYYITDGNDSLSAEDLYYDNSYSELSSENAKAAIDEVNMKVDNGIDNLTPVRLTQKEYDALPDSKLTDGKTYYITDGNNELSAKDLYYDNSYSKLSSKNVNSAIDETKEEIENLKINFQNAIDGIYNAIVAQGTTPASKSQSDVESSISTLSTNRYNAGVDATKVGTAEQNDVLIGKTFTNSNGVGITGTLANSEDMTF